MNIPPLAEIQKLAAYNEVLGRAFGIWNSGQCTEVQFYRIAIKGLVKQNEELVAQILQIMETSTNHLVINAEN